ncbi:hypothetical protein MMPV_002403 [Pyropia vietnamensis]
MALSGVARITITLPHLRTAFGGSDAKRGHVAYRTLRALYRGDKSMEAYLAAIAMAMAECRNNGYTMSKKTATAIVLDQAGLDVSQQASTVATAAMHSANGADDMSAMTTALRDLWGGDAVLKASPNATMLVVTYAEHQAFLARRSAPAGPPAAPRNDMYRPPGRDQPASCPLTKAERSPPAPAYNEDLAGPGRSKATKMSGSYKSYRVEVGPIPDMTDVPGWAEAWGREVARGWTQTTWAHHVFKALDHASPGNAFVKQMAALPDAGMPDDTDRSDSITVVRRPSEVGYMRHYEEVKQLLTDDDLQAPHMDYVVMKPPYIGRSTNYPTHATLTHCRNQRTTRVGFLVGWHQAEFPSCPVPLRAGLYVRVPAWWPSVEVPYGAMVEVPPVQAYAAKELMNRDTLALNVLRSEWAVLAGAFLLESYRARNILWLYPPVLCQWILRVGSSFICQGEDGHDEEAAEELEALLTLLPNVPSGPAFTQHLRQLDPVRRDRSSWVRVVILRRGTIEALVDEDLHPYEMPYSAEVMDNRAMSSGADGWDARDSEGSEGSAKCRSFASLD